MSRTYKVTKVEAQKRPGRYNVYLNEKYAFPISEEVLIKFSIFKGTELTHEEIEQIKVADSISKLYGKAVDFISYRQRTEKEVRDKLKTLSEDEFAIDSTIKKLIEIRLIDDENYANSYVRQTADGQAKGPIEAKRYLMQKGVSETLILNALDEFYPASKVQENADRLAQKLFDHNNRYPYNKRIEKAKLSMVRKGFSFDVIDQAISQIDDVVDMDEQEIMLKKAGLKLWKKYRTEEPYKRKQKVKQALFRKGFDFDAIDEFVDEVEGV
ncbi:recombination regulator RecX [Fructilactobacillus sp. Tb1]|uniref:recombination regulator RecX n=1 Tax=Fructilactobacillus sp. Tb1 TaxID=3422304 RepID=UPI003D27C72B